MKKKSIALFCACVFLFSGCSFKASDPTIPNAETAHTMETEKNTGTEEPSGADHPSADDGIIQTNTSGAPEISFELITKSYPDSDKKKVLLNTEYLRPTVTISANDTASEKIAGFFEREEAAFVSDAKEMLASAKEYYKEVSSEGDAYADAFYSDCKYEVKRCDSNILSFQSLRSSFTGGIHGEYVYNGLNFDASTGQLLTLDDISTDKDALLETAKNYILSQLALPRYADNLNDTPENLVSDIEDFVLKDDTWYFTNSGITFVANIYLLAPYAAGAYFFTVPYQQLQELKPEYLYYGPFELSAPIGSNLTANLDGNEDIDAIFYDCVENTDTGELSCTFTINGTDFSSYLNNEDCQLSPGATADYNLEYYVVDLDMTDEFREIAIQDNGPSADYVTHFFRYDRGNLTYLGCIHDLLDFPSCRINGDGTIKANLLLSLLETANTSVLYQLNNRKLELVPQEWYYVDETTFPEGYQTHNILKDVTVYRENDLNSETVTLTHLNGPVTFPATDNEHWFMLKTPDEQLYYLYLEDGFQLESGESVTDVFENLLLAG